MQILEMIGIDFLHEDAKRILKQASCEVAPNSDRVRMGRDFVMEQVKRAPSSFDIIPRNPEKTLNIGGNMAAFGQVASPPNVSDLDAGRRLGNRRDYQNLLRLSQHFNCINFISGYPVEPVDIRLRL